MPRVVILIFSHKAHLEWQEEISLRQCFRVLGNHPICLICPEGLDITAYRAVAPRLEFDFIPARCFSSVRSYNRLKILPFLYQRYSRYEYMLTYELDAFVFKDELAYWCDQQWDYIGAPWFEGHGNATPASPPMAGGNSGFSLLRISTMLRVLQSWTAVRPAAEVFAEWRRDSHRSPRRFWWLFRNLTWRNCFHHRLNRFTENEDIFWSYAGIRIAGFRLAPYQIASQFSFESNPERLFMEQGEELPFGCHKWFGSHSAFWQRFIEAEGYLWLEGLKRK